MILYFAADLLWGVRIKSTAEDLGIPARPVRNPEMLDARLADSSPRGLILDLETEQAGIDLLAHLRAREAGPDWKLPRLRVVAFAPHVKVDLMELAARTGADEVMPRGAFDHKMAAIMRSLAASGS